MSRHTQPPLFIDVSDRRCLRLYLALSHLTVLVLVSLTVQHAWPLFALSLPVLLSGYYWRRRERERDHPRVLKWNEPLGWRFGYADRDEPLQSVRLLVLGSCLLLEAKCEQGGEVLFLRRQPGMNQLRYLLRRSPRMDPGNI